MAEARIFRFAWVREIASSAGSQESSGFIFSILQPQANTTAEPSELPQVVQS